MKIEQFIIHSVAFEPILIVFRPFFPRSTFCNVAHSPWFALRTDFGFFLLHFESIFCDFVSKFYYDDWFFYLFSFQTIVVFTELKNESHFSYRFIFGYRYFCCFYSCRLPPLGLCDIVELFSLARSQFENEHESEWQSGRIYLEFFITSWNLRVRCAFSLERQFFLHPCNVIEEIGEIFFRNSYRMPK